MTLLTQTKETELLHYLQYILTAIKFCIKIIREENYTWVIVSIYDL